MMDTTDRTWESIAAPVPADIVQWRQQGKPKARGDKFFAIFVAYIDAQFVRERLDSVVPGRWNLTLEPLPLLNVSGSDDDEPVAFKARLEIMGVTREDVGTGRDYKTASTDAFKRAAVRFGIAHELYTDYEVISVQVDGDGKYAKAVEDPAAVWARKQRKAAGKVAPDGAARASREEGHAQPAPAPSAVPHTVMMDGKPLDTYDSKTLEKVIRQRRGDPKFDRLVKAAEELVNNRSLGVAPPVREETSDETMAQVHAAVAKEDDGLPF